MYFDLLTVPCVNIGFSFEPETPSTEMKDQRLNEDAPALCKFAVECECTAECESLPIGVRR